MPPERIAPTVGLNSKCLRVYCVYMASTRCYGDDENLITNTPPQLAPLQLVGRIDIGGARINFQDLGGQTDLQSIWERYYRECHAIVFVVDSSDPERIEECRDALGRSWVRGRQCDYLCNLWTGLTNITICLFVFHDKQKKSLWTTLSKEFLC